MGVLDDIMGAGRDLIDGAKSHLDSRKEQPEMDLEPFKKALEDLSTGVEGGTMAEAEKAFEALGAKATPDQKAALDKIRPIWDGVKADEVLHTDEYDRMKTELEKVFGKDQEQKTFGELAEHFFREHPKLRELVKQWAARTQAKGEGAGLGLAFLAGEAVSIIQKIETEESGAGGDAEDESAENASDGDGAEGAPDTSAEATTPPEGNSEAALSPEAKAQLEAKYRENFSHKDRLSELMVDARIDDNAEQTAEQKEEDAIRLAMIAERVNKAFGKTLSAEVIGVNGKSFDLKLSEGNEVSIDLIYDEKKNEFSLKTDDNEPKPLTDDSLNSVAVGIGEIFPETKIDAAEAPTE